VVNRIFERLEERLEPVVQPKPFVAGGPDTPPRVVSTPVPVIKQRTIIKYLVSLKKGEDGTITRGTHRESGAQPTSLGETLGADGPDTPPREVSTPRGHSPERVDCGGAGETYRSSTRPTGNEQPSGPSDTEGTSDDINIYRESGAQPTPLEETLGATGPNTQPRDVLTPQGHGPERFVWRVDLRDNTYKYERLMEPEGPAEHTRGKNPDTPFRTPITQDLKHIRLMTRWSDELLGGRWGLDQGSSALREDTRWRGQDDSPVSHNNVWDRVVALV